MTSPSNRQNQKNKKIIKANNINIVNSSTNNNKYPSSNNKVLKKENTTKNNMNNSTNNAKKINVPTKNDIKNSKKSDYFKSKNSAFKYEDKFFMMKEDDELDRQKHNKYNYNINTDKNVENKKIIQSEKNNKNKDEDLDNKDWDYVLNKNKNNEENNSNQNNNVSDIENYIENEEKEENEDVPEEEEGEGEINHIEDKDDSENLNFIGEDIISKHMVIIKEAANILSEEGDLITNIKGVGKAQNFTLDNYIDGLESIVDKKLDMYAEIKSKIKKYRKAQKINGQS
jgi:hypothetical protein